MKRRFYLLVTFNIFSLILLSRGIVWAAEEKASNVWVNFFFSWGPILLLIAVWIFYMRKVVGSRKKIIIQELMNIWKNKNNYSSVLQKP